MEDNNKNFEQNGGVHRHFNHDWKKCLAMLLAAFLGGFLAFYFVADQMMLKYARMPFNPKKFEKRMLDDMERMYKQDMKAFEDSFRLPKIKKIKNLEAALPVFMLDTVKIKTEFNDDKFNIIVGLKPFENNADNINYNAEGRKLTVYGNSKVKEKDYEHDVSFSQDFILPENADIAGITKEQDNHNVIISVPLK